MRFEWDEHKNAANQKKHGLSFEEASTLFESGADYLEIFDSKHSSEEDRFIAIGLTERGLVLVVWIEIREGLIRIISARTATRREAELFAERTRGRP